MKITLTEKAKEKLLEMQEKDMPIMLTAYPVGCCNYTYKIISANQTEDDNLYNIDGISIIVANELEKAMTEVKINFGGLFLKDFIVTPKLN